MASASEPEEQYARRRPKWGIALLMLVAIGVFALLREHWTHVAGYWLYLLLLACPVMHLFGHHGGHGHEHAGHRKGPE